MNRRGFFLAGLGGIAAAALAPMTTEAQAQPYGYGYGPPPGHRRRRRRRCWIENVQVPARDRFGRPTWRWVQREVCR